MMLIKLGTQEQIKLFNKIISIVNDKDTIITRDNVLPASYYFTAGKNKISFNIHLNSGKSVKIIIKGDEYVISDKALTTELRQKCKAAYQCMLQKRRNDAFTNVLKYLDGKDR